MRVLVVVNNTVVNNTVVVTNTGALGVGDVAPEFPAT